MSSATWQPFCSGLNWSRLLCVWADRVTNYAALYGLFLWHHAICNKSEGCTFLICRGPADIAWWRHQMETLSALLAICAGNSPVYGEFPTQRPVTRSFGVFFDLRLNKRLSKQSWGWWLETPSRSLWRQCNGAFYWWEDEPVNNKESNGLPTSPPPLSRIACWLPWCPI